MKLTLKPYQKADLKWLRSRNFAGYFADMGAGKTATLLELLRVEKRQALIIAPKRVAEITWPMELAKWDGFKDMTYELVMGTPQQREEAFSREATLYITNYEQILWLFRDREDLIEEYGLPEVLILDESTRLKNAGKKKKRFSALKPYLSAFERRYTLTGTPMPNGDEQELFGQIYCLDEGAALGAYITHFRNQYFYSKGYGGYTYELRDGAEGEIWEKVGHLVRRREVPKESEPTIQDVWLDMPKEAQKPYRQMELELIAELETGTIDAFNAGAKAMKMRQIVQGFMYDHRKVSHFVHDAKLEVLNEIIADIGKPTLIAYNFAEEASVLESCGVPVLTGATRTEATNLVNGWNAGELPLLGLHPKSAGHGLNLQGGGHHLIFLCLDYAPEPYQQVIGRIDRPGQRNQVFIHRILMRDTIDEVLVQAQDDKAGKQGSFLDALRDRYGA